MNIRPLLAVALSLLVSCAGMGSSGGGSLATAELQVGIALSSVRDLRTYQTAHGLESGIADALEAPLAKVAEEIHEARVAGRETLDVRELLVAFDAASMPLLEASDPRLGQFAIAARAAVNLLALALGSPTLEQPPAPPAPPAGEPLAEPESSDVEPTLEP